MQICKQVPSIKWNALLRFKILWQLLGKASVPLYVQRSTKCSIMNHDSLCNKQLNTENSQTLRLCKNLKDMVNETSKLELGSNSLHIKKVLNVLIAIIIIYKQEEWNIIEYSMSKWRMANGSRSFHQKNSFSIQQPQGKYFQSQLSFEILDKVRISHLRF